MPDLTVTVNAPVTKVVEIGGQSPGTAVAISDLNTRLITSGAYLQSLITVSSAGVSTINGHSGALTLVGTGNTTVTSNGQQIIISGSQTNTGSYYPLTGNPSHFLSNGDIVKFTTTLTSGVDNQVISYPSGLSLTPEAITCEMVNDIDNLIYSHVINSVNTGNFKINFSDNLSAAGYQLYTTILI